MSRESLVAALEEAKLPSDAAKSTYYLNGGHEFGELPHLISTDAGLLLPILLAHATPDELATALQSASPEAKAAALRGLLGERERALMRLGEAAVEMYEARKADIFADRRLHTATNHRWRASIEAHGDALAEARALLAPEAP